MDIKDFVSSFLIMLFITIQASPTLTQWFALNIELFLITLIPVFVGLAKYLTKLLNFVSETKYGLIVLTIFGIYTTWSGIKLYTQSWLMGDLTASIFALLSFVTLVSITRYIFKGIDYSPVFK